MYQNSLLTSYIFPIAVLGPPLGQAMLRAEALKTTMPVILEVQQKDSGSKKAMKRLILDMTQCRPEDRPSMDDVELQLTAIEGEITVMIYYVSIYL